MKIAIIGRTQFLYGTILKLIDAGHVINVVVTSEASPEYTKNEKDFEELCRVHKIPCFVTSKLNGSALCRLLAESDIGVSMNWVSIINQKEIDYFKFGILNAHFGDLPRYRGNACPNWAIINGERDVTVSIHLMEDGELDCGRIILQEKLPITENTYIEDIYKWGEKKIPQLFLNSLSILQKNSQYTLKYADCDAVESMRCYPRKPEDGRIDWRDTTESIHRLIRASGPPFAGAFAFLEDEKITIWRAEVYKDGERYRALPGQICEAGNDYFVVITGRGKLKIVKWECRKKINSIRQRLS